MLRSVRRRARANESSIVELKIIKRTKSYYLRVELVQRSGKDTSLYQYVEQTLLSDACLKLNNLKSREVTYGSVKVIKVITSFLTNRKTTPKITILFVKQRQTSSNFSDKITSAHAITSCCHGKYKNPNDFRTLPKTGLKPHFAYFRPFLNIFEQNEWQIRFSQTKFTLISEK